MALNDTQKKGVGYLITAAFFAVVGVFLMAAGSVPLIVPIIMDAVILIVAGYGIYAITKPET